MRALSVKKIVYTLRRLQSLLPTPTPIQGLRTLADWTVADGEPATIQAIQSYLENGGCAPPEVTMVTQLVALYGGQVAISGRGVMLFLPAGFPGRITRIAEASGFYDVSDEQRTYHALRWTP